MAQTKVTNFYASRRRGNSKSSFKRKLPLIIERDGSEETICKYGKVSLLPHSEEATCELTKVCQKHAVKPTSRKRTNPWNEADDTKFLKASNKPKESVNKGKRKGRRRAEDCEQLNSNTQDIRVAFRNLSRSKDQVDDLQEGTITNEIDTNIVESPPECTQNEEDPVSYIDGQEFKTPTKRTKNNSYFTTPLKRQKRWHEIKDDNLVTPGLKENDLSIPRGTPRSARKLVKDFNSEKTTASHLERKIETELSGLNSSHDDGASPQMECFTSEHKIHCDASEKDVYDILSLMKDVPKPISSIPNSPSKIETSAFSKSPTLKKKLTSNEVRERLQKCGKLEELKERLFKIKSCSAKLKESQRVKPDGIVADTKSGIHSISSSQKIKEEKIRPAYERFHSLATPAAPSLTLPYSYKLLSEAFHCCDIVVSMLHNRQEVCTFDKLKKSVEDMMKRTFDRLKLGQIKTVFPLAYIFSQEKGEKSFLSNNCRNSKYQLVVSPNFDYVDKDLNNLTADTLVTDIKNISLTSSIQSSIHRKAVKIMAPACLIERRAIFTSNLLEIVKKHHQKYLAGLMPPVIVPVSSLTRWHPRFPLDNVPDVVPSSLPEPPDIQKYSTAHDVLQRVRGTVGEKVEQALESVANKHAVTTEESNKMQDLTVNKKINTGVLKGISQDLLNKIRAREAAHLAKEMTRTPAQGKRLEMMSCLPEMIRILRTYFITERRAAVSMEDAAKKVSDSYHSPITPEEVQKYLILAAELLPDWLFQISIRKGLFLKIDKNADIHHVIEKITDTINREKRL